MLWKLILLLTVVPIAELYLLVKLTQWWGSFGVTVAVIVGTGVLGAALARMEGLRVLARMREQIARAELPADSLIDAVLILVAAALLLTPGVMTDAVGFFLLIPPSRALIRRLLKRWIRKQMAAGSVRFYRSGGFGAIRNEPPEGFPPLEDEDERRDRST